MSPPTYFPLRWESTGDQWWYASPIDWAAANGHYDLVRELLRIDANHLIKLTSLRRIRRLETVWDDERQFHDVARCRSEVAKNLLAECDAKKGRNSLVGSGYGGWLLYTAASAGDLAFVQELLARDPLLVFGEAEYGVTDILYAAARSKDSEVFRVILDFASLPRFSTEVEMETEIPSGYKLEITNRALHAAARGGNLRLMKELITACSDNTLSYRDMQGATILHAAAARGQTEVVKYLVSAFSSILNSVDDEGNSALHVAAHRGHLAVVEALILASPDSINTRNNAGETFIHSIVAGFQTPGFRRLDRQIDLLKHLLRFDVENVINVRNNDGRTALHLAITGNVHSDLVELLMTIRGIDVNIRDNNGMTPLDVLRRKPISASSEILTRQLISAGGIFGCRDYSTRKVIASHIRRQSVGNGNSPGTSFRISDVEIFLYTGMENNNTSDGSNNHNRNHSYLSEKGFLREDDSKPETNPRKPDKLKRLKRYLFSKVKKETASERLKKLADESSERVQVSSLRERFSSNKRPLSESPGPTAKRKAARHGAAPIHPRKSRSSSSFSKLSFSSQTSLDTQKAGEIEEEMTKVSNEDGPKSSSSSIQKLMNPYLCFGGPAQHVETTIGAYDVYERSVLSAA